MDITTVTIGVVFSCATYLILQRRLTQVIFGFLMFSNGVNLLLLATSRNPDKKIAPLIQQEPRIYVDPIPQALILTAIVIGFALMAHFVILCYRLYLLRGQDDIVAIFDKGRKE